MFVHATLMWTNDCKNGNGSHIIFLQNWGKMQTKFGAKIK